MTRKRLYLETMEQVLGRVDKVILDEQCGRTGRRALSAAERLAQPRPRRPEGPTDEPYDTSSFPSSSSPSRRSCRRSSSWTSAKRRWSCSSARSRPCKEEPGLGFKIPLIQEVVRYDDRILSLDVDRSRSRRSDDRRLVVDAFARYRIAIVKQFRQAVGASGECAGRRPDRHDPERPDPRGSGFGQLRPNDPVRGPGGPGRRIRDAVAERGQLHWGSRSSTCV